MNSTSEKAKKPEPSAAGQLVQRAWEYCGISRSAFFRAMSSGRGPRAVSLPGSRRPFYRKRDLDAWLDRLKNRRV